MSGYALVREYPVPVELVWRALTEPRLVSAWTATGQSGTPVDFLPIVGTKFQFLGRPTIGWNGIVDCEVLAIEPPRLLRFSWRGGIDDDTTTVTCALSTVGTGTRLSWEHEGFTGIGGFIVSRILSSVRKKMLDVGLPPVLARLAAEARA